MLFKIEMRSDVPFEVYLLENSSASLLYMLRVSDLNAVVYLPADIPAKGSIGTMIVVERRIPLWGRRVTGFVFCVTLIFRVWL